MVIWPKVGTTHGHGVVPPPHEVWILQAVPNRLDRYAELRAITLAANNMQ